MSDDVQVQDEVKDEIAGQLSDEAEVVSGGPTAMDVVDSIQDELSSESVSTNQALQCKHLTN